MTDTGATPPEAAPVSRQWAREQRSGGKSRHPTPAPTPETSPGSAPEQPAAPGRGGRRPLGRGAVVAYSVATLIFVAGLVALAWDGYRTSLDIKGGTALESERNPLKPGYEAQVKPIPTHLLLLTDPKGAVTDGLLMAEGNAGKGGSIVLIPGGTIVQGPTGNINFDKLIATAGVPAGVTAMEKVLTFAVTDTATIGDKQWADLLTPLGSLAIENPDALVSVTGPNQKQIVYPAGTITLDPGKLGDYLTFVSDGEAAINRLPRVQLVLEAWLKALAANPAGAPTLAPLTPVIGEQPVDISALISGLSKGQVSYQILPTQAVSLPDANGAKIYLPDPVGIAAMVPKVVPFPTSAFPGQRARTRILNGTTDAAAATRAAAPVVGAGGEVTVLGNAAKFGRTRTVVEYHDPTMKDAAGKIAAALAVTATPSTSLTEAYDVTVTLGSDFTG